MINLIKKQAYKPIIFNSLARTKKDSEENYLQLSKRRKIEIENPEIRKRFLGKMDGFNLKDELAKYLCRESAMVK